MGSISCSFVCVQLWSITSILPIYGLFIDELNTKLIIAICLHVWQAFWTKQPVPIDDSSRSLQRRTARRLTIGADSCSVCEASDVEDNQDTDMGTEKGDLMSRRSREL